jgi:hypothetical protein
MVRRLRARAVDTWDVSPQAVYEVALQDSPDPNFLASTLATPHCWPDYGCDAESAGGKLLAEVQRNISQHLHVVSAFVGEARKACQCLRRRLNSLVFVFCCVLAPFTRERSARRCRMHVGVGSAADRALRCDLPAAAIDCHRGPGDQHGRLSHTERRAEAAGVGRTARVVAAWAVRHHVWRCHAS